MTKSAHGKAIRICKDLFVPIATPMDSRIQGEIRSKRLVNRFTDTAITAISKAPYSRNRREFRGSDVATKPIQARIPNAAGMLRNQVHGDTDSLTKNE